MPLGTGAAIKTRPAAFAPTDGIELVISFCKEDVAMWKRIITVAVFALLFVGAEWCARAGSPARPAPAAVDSVKAKIARDVYAQMMVRWRNNEANDLEDL